MSVLSGIVPRRPRFFSSPLAGCFLGKDDKYVALYRTITESLLTLGPSTHCAIVPRPLCSRFKLGGKEERTRRELKLRPKGGGLLFFKLVHACGKLSVLLRTFKGLSSRCRLVVTNRPCNSFSGCRAVVSELPGERHVFASLGCVGSSRITGCFSTTSITILPCEDTARDNVDSISCRFRIPVVMASIKNLGRTVKSEKANLITPRYATRTILARVSECFSSPTVRGKYVRGVHVRGSELS